MSYRNTRRLNKSISPLAQKNITPQNNFKYSLQTMGQSNINSVNHPFPKQFNEGYSAYSNKNRHYNNNGREFRDEDVYNSTLAEINLELDNNMNEIIYLFGRRKTLTSAKKKKIRDEIEEKMEKARNFHHETNSFEYSDDDQFLKVVNFCQNTQLAIKVLTKAMSMLGNIRGSKGDQEDKSQAFWAKNKQLENQMDAMLEKLKGIDKNLEKQNKEVLQICKSLDSIQETLKSIAGIKGEDNIQKVEPLFNSKKKNYDSLNIKIKDRERFKDLKIDNIKRICDALMHLKQTRQSRLSQIAKFFGLSNVWQFDKFNFKEAGDFTKGFDELLKIREKQSHLGGALKQVMDQIDHIEIEQDHIYNELLKKQSDEARAYHSYSKIVNQKIKYQSILSLFTDENCAKSGPKIFTLSQNQLSKKFAQYKNFLKRFLEQDSLIKQGLVKTCETLDTFVTVQKSIENEKQRRHQLLMILQTYIHKKADYSHKKQELRTLSVQETKNQQKLAEYEEQLEVILADGDIDSYKKIGNLIGQCQLERTKLMHRKQKLQKQMEVMDREVVGMASKIKQEYEDILCEIVPSDYQYQLADGDDVRKLRNHLRKMYRRLRILGNQ